MTVEQINLLYKFSTSTIYKVNNGNTQGLKEDTINVIKFLLNLDVDYVKALFMRVEFADMISLVLARATKRHHKESAHIIRLADKCLRRHNTLKKDFVVRHITDDDFSKGELLGIYYADAKQLLMDEYFQPLCDVATELAVKDRDLRSFIAFMYDVSGMFIKIDANKKKELPSDAVF